jgi:hypothetical protein
MEIIVAQRMLTTPYDKKHEHLLFSLWQKQSINLVRKILRAVLFAKN